MRSLSSAPAPAPAATGHLAGDRSLSTPSLLIIFLLVASLLPNGGLSEHSAAGEEGSSRHIRLPSELGAGSDDGRVVCAPSPSTSCPVKCFRADPVCGADGITYWCGCAEAACAGVLVAKLGFCGIGNGGDVPVAGQALQLVHIIWLVVLGFSVVFGLF